MTNAPNAERIRDALSEALKAKLIALDCYAAIGSTNDELMAAPVPAPGQVRLAIADHQTAGRGRSGKTWHLPPGAGLCLSFATTLPVDAARIAPLTLSVGVALTNALRALGADAMIKWPNDLVHDGHKLGGILVERRNYPEGSSIVIGVGLNVQLPPGFGDNFDQPAALPPGDITTAVGNNIDRDALAASVANALHEACVAYAKTARPPSPDDWAAIDFLHGRRITVESPGKSLTGTAQGIAASGALCVSDDSGKTTTADSGSVRLL
ncbi:MAG: biotin--[acetyl-CoA-carboxylase] ligase [Pseudomonadota bacterium]